MSKKRRRTRAAKGGKFQAFGISAAIILIILLVFFFMFRVTDIKIAGNTRYVDDVILQYVQDDILMSNTMLASWFRKHIEVDDIPFVESFDVEALDSNTIRVYVNEKQIVGYVVHGADKLYFDKDGYVLECISVTEEEIQAAEELREELEVLRLDEERRQDAQDALVPEGGNLEDGTEDGAETGAEDDIRGTQNTGDSEDDQVTQETSSEDRDDSTEDVEYQAEVADVPRILGLRMENLILGERIQVEDESVFNTILGITRIVDKYEILPELVYFDEDYNITLVYQDNTILCQLGPDSLLEEKITRVAAILPNLISEIGILHLEEYTQDTANIIFSKESEYTVKSKINAFLEKNS